MIALVARGIALLALGFAFGALLKVSDLLQEHGYRWAGRRGGDLVAGVLTTLAALGMLALSARDSRVFWFSVVLSWLLRGRIDGMNHGVMAYTIALFVLATVPPTWVGEPRFWYFLIPLTVLGVLHDLFQYTSLKAPQPILWFFEQQHLYWYLLVIGYMLLFERDVVFAATVYGFVKGYGFFYPEERRKLLERVGIRASAPP